MNNNNDLPPPILDSFGRITGTAKSFFNYSAASLQKLGELISLTMSAEELELCRNHYRKKGLSDISFSELYLLDEISKVSHSLSQNATIDDIYTDNLTVIETFNDLVSKHTFIGDGTIEPLSLSTLSNVAAKYMDKVGLEYKEQEITTSPIGISAFLDTRVIYPETAFILITPLNEDVDYDTAINALSGYDIFYQNLISARFVDKFGIAVALLKMSNGIFADIFALPEVGEHPELSQLATLHHGRLIAALPKQILPALSEAAKGLGLRLSYFAKSALGEKITLYTREHISMSLDSEMMLALANKTYNTDVKILGENQLNSFLKASDSVTDAIMPLLADGNLPEDISLLVRYTLPSSYVSTEAVSTILGTYRSIVELCIPNKAEIYFSDYDEVKAECSAHSDNSALLPTMFSMAGNNVYFISYNTSDNGLADFDSFRKMYKFLSKLYESENIYSTKAINGNIIEALEEMKGEFDFEFSSEAISLGEKAQKGIIIESDNEQKYAIPLGKIYHFSPRKSENSLF